MYLVPLCVAISVNFLRQKTFLTSEIESEQSPDMSISKNQVLVSGGISNFSNVNTMPTPVRFSSTTLHVHSAYPVIRLTVGSIPTCIRHVGIELAASVHYKRGSVMRHADASRWYLRNKSVRKCWYQQRHCTQLGGVPVRAPVLVYISSETSMRFSNSYQQQHYTQIVSAPVRAQIPIKYALTMITTITITPQKQQSQPPSLPPHSSAPAHHHPSA
jgi:hypothetical protein